jgi:hypothetical protein
METNTPNSPDFALQAYRTQDDCDNTLDDAQLETRCPLDNGRHDCTPVSTYFTTNQLDRLPIELLVEVLLQLDIPSLTRFRGLKASTAAQWSLSTRFTSTPQSSSIALTSSAPLSASRRTRLTAVRCTERFVRASVPRAIALATISIL